MQSNRRAFIGRAATTVVSYKKILGANERVRIGGIGAGYRGRYLLTLLSKTGGAELVAVCDVNTPTRQRVRHELAPDASEYVDYRDVLARRDVDAVVVATPDHWHVPITIDAIRAGKDVYVEKPVTHTMDEGELLAKAVRDCGRVIQVGTQRRSTPHFQKAKEIVASGRLGSIPLVLTHWYQSYLMRANPHPKIDIAKLDWERWLGPAPHRPFAPERFARWRWYWDYGGGALTDLFSHWVDIVHWCMNEDQPIAAQATGERVLLRNQECPDTINATFRYRSGFLATYTGSMTVDLEDGGLAFRGTKALLKIDRDALALYPEPANELAGAKLPDPEIAIHSVRDGTIDHLENFLECIKSRKTPNVPVAAGIAAANAGHMGNLSLRRNQ